MAFVLIVGAVLGTTAAATVSTWMSGRRLQGYRDALRAWGSPVPAGQDKDVVLTTRLELIQRAAEESLQAYGESDDIATLHWKIQDKAILKRGLLLKYWPETNTMIIAFRGTASFKDGINNLKVSPTEFPVFNSPAYKRGSKVHTGFTESLLEFLPYLRANSEFSQCYQAANPTIICCGHSLGGAMATLCAAWIKTHHSSGAIVYCVTFGSPRVGNEIFRDNVHAALDVTRTFRVVMEGDPVPEVPSVGNWCHVGRKVLCNQRTTELELKLEGPARIPLVAGLTKLLTSLPEHMMLTYHHFLVGREDISTGAVLENLDTNIPIRLGGRPQTARLMEDDLKRGVPGQATA